MAGAIPATRAFNRAQYSILVTVVVLTALIPTMIAPTFFQARSHTLDFGSESRSDGRPVGKEA